MWTMAEAIGYTPKTTFWEDFSTADKFGTEAITDTAENIFEEWKTNIEYLTEFIMVINHKSWEHENDPILMELYSNLYYEYDEKAIHFIEQTMSDKELNYYFRTLD